MTNVYDPTVSESQQSRNGLDGWSDRLSHKVTEKVSAGRPSSEGLSGAGGFFPV